MLVSTTASAVIVCYFVAYVKSPVYNIFLFLKHSNIHAYQWVNENNSNI